MIDLLWEGLDGLRAHRVRSLLSALGILFGVAAVIGILSIGEGARRETAELIELLGVQNIQIKSVTIEADEELAEEVARKSQGLTRRDVDALRVAIPDAISVGGLREIPVQETAPRPREHGVIRVVGADPSYLAALKLIRLEGRALTEKDEETRASVCLVGQEAAWQLWGTDSPVGQRIRLEGVWLTVVGVMAEADQSGNRKRVDGLDLDDRSRDIVMPLTTALARFPLDELEPELSEILVALSDQKHVKAQSELCGRVLNRLHREQPDFELVIPLRLLEQSQSQQRLFNLVMGLIAGISLLVGGIGIMNIMLASVLERTREIGVRLAVGASPRDILLLFVTEAALISLIGGVAGILAGYGISFLVASATGWSTAVSLHAVALAALISMLEGVLFGFLPARRAANMAPVLALRQ